MDKHFNTEQECLDHLNAELRRNPPQPYQAEDGFWILPHDAHYVRVDIPAGTLLRLNNLHVEVQGNCQIEFPLSAMNLLIISLSHRPANIQYRFTSLEEDDRLRRYPTSLHLPDGTMVVISGGCIVNN